MSGGADQARPLGDLEGLLRQALAPVEPPPDLAERLEGTLTEIHGLATGELEGWELSAMRDPSRWPQIPRAVAAAGIATGAGAALVVLRVRAQQRKRTATDPLDLVESTMRAAVDETRRLLDR
ncbi:hypothetical protein [Conexibacter sp. SYSU D00693]|uniref:hypothetical protein n=1 Tax=Conexibacter sp. SYSU D00693 TaxID=2812560 RepID=UPI001F11C7E3|nr:hypothetical protein [Conexibacter sp. SYSU D00693]